MTRRWWQCCASTWAFQAPTQDHRPHDGGPLAHRFPFRRRNRGSSAVNGLSAIALMLSLSAGAISFLSPCVLPLVPGYLSFMSGRSVARGAQSVSTLTALASGLAFVAGFATVFTTLGASATAAGRLLLAYKNEANVVGGMIVAVFGLV